MILLYEYILSIVLLYISFILYVIRAYIHRDRFILEKSKEGYFGYVRLIIISIIPIFNIVVAGCFVYGLLLSEDEFRNLVNGRR